MYHHLVDRLLLFLVGGLVGFALGYLARSVREIEEEIEIIDPKFTKNSRGESQTDLLLRVGLFLVVVLTAWSAFSTQKANNRIQDTQNAVARITVCNQQYLEKTIAALNERTTYTAAQSQANVVLQSSQAQFLNQLLDRSKSSSQHLTALHDYVDALTFFVTISSKSANKVAENPYPTPEELQTCLHSPTNTPLPKITTTPAPSPSPSKKTK